jgi:hypothetical protein
MQMSVRHRRADAAAAAPPVAEQLVNIRQLGNGYQYEVQWTGQQDTTWEPAWRVRQRYPLLVQQFEQQRQAAEQHVVGDDQQEAAGAGQEGASHQGEGENDAASQADMRQQMEALQQLVLAQGQQLQQLRSFPPLAAAQSPGAQPSSASLAVAPPQQSPASQSRFARKEPRAQDLREYDGASGPKLDEWLDELGAAVELYELTGAEAVLFAASRLREAARLWWNALGAAGKASITSVAVLGVAMRSRFQPITAAETARDQLDKLQQGSRAVNDYIAEFQRLRSRLPAMTEEDALHAFVRGLRRDIAVELRKQRIKTVADGIELASHVGSIAVAAAPQAVAVPLAARVAAHQMEVGSDGVGALGDSIAKAVLTAMQAQQVSAGGHTMQQPSLQASPASQQPYRGYPNQSFRGRGGAVAKNGRGGRFPLQRRDIHIPGVPDAVVEQRREKGLCFRCGSADHRSVECPNSCNASPPPLN